MTSRLTPFNPFAGQVGTQALCRTLQLGALSVAVWATSLSASAQTATAPLFDRLPASVKSAKVLKMVGDSFAPYRIVGDDEADIKQNMISVNSPIARALIGKEVDDVAIVKTPAGDVEYEILEVAYL